MSAKIHKMTESTHAQEEAEIILIDILLFLKASTRNVLTSTATCLLLGALYYFSVPNMYEATATIQMATVGGELIETPAVLLEKIKSPQFFSPATLQACGAKGDLSSQSKFADTLNPTLNKLAPLITITSKTLSSNQSRECLDAVIGDIQKSQNELARPLIEQKKEELTHLRDLLKFAEDIVKSALAAKAIGNVTETQFSSRVLMMTIDLKLSEDRKKSKFLKLNFFHPKLS